MQIKFPRGQYHQNKLTKSKQSQGKKTPKKTMISESLDPKEIKIISLG